MKEKQTKRKKNARIAANDFNHHCYEHIYESTVYRISYGIVIQQQWNSMSK